MGEKLTITFDLFDTGCLPALLRRELAETKRHYSIVGDRYDEDATNNHHDYVKQLEGCIAAVDAARMARR